MSKDCSLESLGLSTAIARKAVRDKPVGRHKMYYMPETGLYYIAATDKRKNAQVYCSAVNGWRTSARYNSELNDTKLFIPMADICSALKALK